MAQTDRFYIGMINEGAGLDTSLKPFAIPENAFQSLSNAYVFRGRVRKRFGSRLMKGSTAPTTGFEQLQSRLRINLGKTSVLGALSGTVPGNIYGIGQAFSVGSEIYTVQAAGVPVTLLSTGTGVATYNTTTGDYNIVGAPAITDVYFYPSDPVMGLITYQILPINDEQIIAFDTQFAYQYISATGWERLGTAQWSGSNADYFWGYTWRGITANQNFLFVTNYNYGTSLTNSDVMKYWNGSAWTNFNPGFTSTVATNTIVTARIIVPFKDRLVLLNVVENTGAAPGTNNVYVNRCRYSWNGDPTNAAAFYEDVPGNGGYIDAPTKEAIITAQFLKDRLIVYFESSTWELVYTGNQILPFVWQQINTELGAESTFSQVPFDKMVLGVGNVGIHACNGTNVERIDNKIPDSVFEIHNENNGIKRVAGIRDYYVEMVYWSFPGYDRNDDYPFNNRILVYNYKTGSWAFNDDSITSFGYYQASFYSGQTWSSFEGSWEEATGVWHVGTLQAKFKSVIAGNQEGYIFILDPDVTRNAPALQVSNMAASGALITVTCINHNLEPGFDGDGDYIAIESAQGVAGINDNIYPVYEVIDPNTFTIIEPNFSGTYTGGGVLTRVSNIEIVTKQYNFYAQQGRNAAINKVDFLIDKTSDGEITVDYSVSSSSESMLDFGNLSGSLLGTGILETSPYVLMPLEDTQDRIWHPVYPMAEGECIQLNIHMNEEQLTDSAIAWSAFVMHAMLFYSTPTTSRLQ